MAMLDPATCYVAGDPQIRCGNAKHPDGAWHTATPVPDRRDWPRRLAMRLRRGAHGCGCTTLRNGEAGQVRLGGRLLITTAGQAGGSPQIDRGAVTCPEGHYWSVVVRRRQPGDRGPFTPNPDAKPAWAATIGWRGPTPRWAYWPWSRPLNRWRHRNEPSVPQAVGGTVPEDEGWHVDGNPEPDHDAAAAIGRAGQAETELARETRRLIASETLDPAHLDELEAANRDPRDQRLHGIIRRRRGELAALTGGADPADGLAMLAASYRVNPEPWEEVLAELLDERGPTLGGRVAGTGQWTVDDLPMAEGVAELVEDGPVEQVELPTPGFPIGRGMGQIEPAPWDRPEPDPNDHGLLPGRPRGGPIGADEAATEQVAPRPISDRPQA